MGVIGVSEKEPYARRPSRQALIAKWFINDKRLVIDSCIGKATSGVNAKKICRNILRHTNAPYAETAPDLSRQYMRLQLG